MMANESLVGVHVIVILRNSVQVQGVVHTITPYSLDIITRERREVPISWRAIARLEVR
jgi:hypothetical protein